jgi:hypothetical protein
MAELISLTAGALAAKLTAREVSARQVIDAHLDRIAATDGVVADGDVWAAKPREDLGDGDVHAFLQVTAKAARDHADDIDRRRAAGEQLGPLAGVPLALKDLLTTRGVPTTCGSRMLEGWVPPYDATVTELVRDADVFLEGFRPGVMKRLGLSSKKRVRVGNHSIAPRDLVVSLLPEPKDLAGRMRGKTCVGTLARGYKKGELRAYYIYNVSDHETAYRELGVQATAYQTGIPPVIAARLIAKGVWRGPGVMFPEQFDPDPFLRQPPEAIATTWLCGVMASASRSISGSSQICG